MIQIDCDFPGGNILVDRIEGDNIAVRPDMRDTEGGWFYWAFRLRGAAGRRLNFDFSPSTPIGMQGPALSADGGLTWAWQPHDYTDGGFTLAVPPSADDMLVAFAPVQTQREWDRFIQSQPYAGVIRRNTGTLCTTRKGRRVEMIYLGASDEAARHRVVITARHHCCEMIAGYAMEGIVDAVLGGSVEGAWLQENVRMLFIPFVDKDGVEDGDQGKNRRPRDHNRDYVGESVHVETAAIRKLAGDWAARRGVDASIDLHCPWIRGHYESFIYQVGREAPANWEAQQCFGKLIEEQLPAGALPYHAAGNLPFGEAWNTAANFSGGKSFSRWCAELPGMRLPTSFEIPYSVASGVAVTPAAARLFGHGVARGLAAFLKG